MEPETSPNGSKVPDADSKEQETDFTERNFIGNTRTTQMIHLFALTDHIVYAALKPPYPLSLFGSTGRGIEPTDPPLKLSVHVTGASSYLFT